MVELVHCEADQKLEAAKVMEQNSHELISEQLAVNETLLQETATKIDAFELCG